jgi:hypothetical protein
MLLEMPSPVGILTGLKLQRIRQMGHLLDVTCEEPIKAGGRT